MSSRNKEPIEIDLPAGCRRLVDSLAMINLARGLRAGTVAPERAADVLDDYAARLMAEARGEDEIERARRQV